MFVLLFYIVDVELMNFSYDLTILRCIDINKYAKCSATYTEIPK